MFFFKESHISGCLKYEMEPISRRTRRRMLRHLKEPVSFTVESISVYESWRKRKYVVAMDVDAPCLVDARHWFGYGSVPKEMNFHHTLLECPW